jgi:hypothetical protein
MLNCRSAPKSQLITAIACLILTTPLACATPVFATPPAPARIVEQIPGTDIVVRPESDRYLDLLVMGIDAPDNAYFLLPDLRQVEDALGEDGERILKALYLLDLELSRGRLFHVLPEYTELYIGIPSSDENSAVSQRARKWFKEYLLERAGWSEARIASRIFFFSSSDSIFWARDISKIIGFDSQGRAILGTAADQSSGQLRALEALQEKYPNKFIIRKYAPAIPDINPNVSVEGGDLELVVAPSGRVELLVGRHRALRYIHPEGTEPTESEYTLSEKDIELARTAYSQSFFNLPVTFVPEEVLKNPSKGSPELFHLDMVMTILPSPQKGAPRAFVPTYLFNPVDAYEATPLTFEFVENVQSEYDRVAAQLTNRGYEVYRLPYADHPVRSPVNVGKYLDRHTGKHTVLMSKYPYHLPLDGQDNPQREFTKLYREINDIGNAFKETHSKKTAQQLLARLEGSWKKLDALAERPNPLFELNHALLERLGYDVKVIPDYTHGAGGIHCKILQ